MTVPRPVWAVSSRITRASQAKRARQLPPPLPERLDHSDLAPSRPQNPGESGRMKIKGRLGSALGPKHRYQVFNPYTELNQWPMLSFASELPTGKSSIHGGFT